MKLTCEADLGLELNEYERKYKKTVLDYLRTAKRSVGMLNWLNSLVHGAERSKDWRGKYSDMINFMETMQKSVRESLEHGEDTRDAFLEAGITVMDKVAGQASERNGIAIFDTYCEDVVVRRRFQSPSQHFGVDRHFVLAREGSAVPRMTGLRIMKKPIPKRKQV